MAHIWDGFYTDYDDDIGEEDPLPCKPRWLRPGSRPVDGDEPIFHPHPDTVLVGTLAHIDGERNFTTAAAARTNGHPIQVTFCIAPPPRISRLAVHCTGKEPNAFPTLPRVVATEDDLLLLQVPVYSGQLLGPDRLDEFFLYRAGAGDRPPILRMIPRPFSTLDYADEEVGILSCSTADRFIIAVLNKDLGRLTLVRHIHLFDSETSAWSTKQVYVDSLKACSHTSTSKVITMGGKRGSMGWVDLWHGILVYDLLRGKDKVRYVPLPSSSPQKSALEGLPGTVRDITVVNGVVKYFAMYSPGVHTTNVSGEWHADTWTMKQPWKKWQHEFHLKASEITADNVRHSELLLRDLPEDAERNKPVLTRLRAGSPVLSLQDDHVVYMLTKPMHTEDKAWVVAVDMNTKTLCGVEEFNAGRTTGLMFTGTQR